MNFSADANLSDDNSKNFELFEEINILVDLNATILKRPNGSSKSSTDNEDEQLVEDLSSPLSPSDWEKENVTGR